MPFAIRSAFRIFDAFLLFFVWLFVLSLFQKDFRLNLLHMLVGVVISGPILAERFVHFGWLDSLPVWWASLVNSTALLLPLHMMLVALTGRSDDLLEQRRKSRLYLTFIIAMSALLAILLGSILLPQQQTTVNVISLWLPIVSICLWLTTVDKQAFTFHHGTQEVTSELSHRDSLLQQRLDEAMTEQRAYLENNLSVDVLASRLGIAAHRLRAFINQKLGYTNFSSYINSFRVNAVKVAFESPENDHIPILTIALNHGFNSLTPFNRAFRKQLGITPSEFRKNTRK